MAFGRRGSGAAFSAASAVRVDRSGQPREASGPIVARRGGYWAGLASAAAGFVGTAICSVAWVFFLDGPPNVSPAGFVLFVVALAGPTVVVGYAIFLAIADGVLRAFRVGGRGAYAGLSTTLAVLLMSLPTWLAHHGARSGVYYFVLVVPGAIIGGLVLGGFRRRER